MLDSPVDARSNPASSEPLAALTRESAKDPVRPGAASGRRALSAARSASSALADASPANSHETSPPDSRVQTPGIPTCAYRGSLLRQCLRQEVQDGRASASTSSSPALSRRGPPDRRSRRGGSSPVMLRGRRTASCDLPIQAEEPRHDPAAGRSVARTMSNAQVAEIFGLELQRCCAPRPGSGRHRAASSASSGHSRPGGLEAPPSLWPGGVPWGSVDASERLAVVVSVASEANGEHRDHMEDGHLTVQPLSLRPEEDGGSLRLPRGQWGLFAVFDGHGGREAVDFCEQHMEAAVAHELHGLLRADRDAVRAALSRAFLKIDARLEEEGCKQVGCTATVALAHRSEDGKLTLSVGNVGDSQAYLLGDGRAREMSTVHRPTTAKEAERVTREGGFVLNGRVGGHLAVSRAMGDHTSKPGVSAEPDVCTYSIQGARILVMASDGLWDFVGIDTVREVLEDLVDQTIATGGERDVAAHLEATAATALVWSALEHGSRDNILVKVVFF